VPTRHAQHSRSELLTGPGVAKTTNGSTPPLRRAPIPSKKGVCRDSLPVAERDPCKMAKHLTELASLSKLPRCHFWPSRAGCAQISIVWQMKEGPVAVGMAPAASAQHLIPGGLIRARLPLPIPHACDANQLGAGDFSFVALRAPAEETKASLSSEAAANLLEITG